MATRSFSPSRENLLAGLALSVVLGGMAAGAVAWGMSHPGERFWLWGGGGAAAAGTALLVYTATLARRRVELCERGLRFRSVAGTEDVLWAEVDHIRHAVVVDRANADSVAIRTKGGRSFCFTANSVGDFPGFLEALQAHSAGGVAPPGDGPASAQPGKVRWRRLSQTALQRWWFYAALGAGLAMAAIVLFFTLDAAERGATAGPVKVHFVHYLLYWVGGKWLAAGLTLAVGLALVALGTWRRLTERSREVELE